MRLVQYDVISGVYRTYELDPLEIADGQIGEVVEKDKLNKLEMLPRRERVWRYEYDTVRNNRIVRVVGFAAIGRSPSVCRRMINDYQREIVRREAA